MGEVTGLGEKGEGGPGRQRCLTCKKEHRCHLIGTFGLCHSFVLSLALQFEKGTIYRCSVVRMHGNDRINNAIQKVGRADYFILPVKCRYM